MDSLKAIIIDDEAHCIRTLRWELDQVSGIEVVSSTDDPEKGIELIRDHRPDILFLDIEMPGMNGFDLLHRLENFDFKLIFTTAYDEYAVQAFEANATAYLLKPVGNEKLRAAIDQVKESNVRLSTERLDKILGDIRSRLKNRRRVALPVSDGTEFISSDSIIYCKSESNYTNVFLIGDKKLLISKTLKDIDNTLNEFGFIRVHKSYLVNPSHINKYVRTDGGYLIMSNGDQVNIANNKREDFMKLFSKL